MSSSISLHPLFDRRGRLHPLLVGTDIICTDSLSNLFAPTTPPTRCTLSDSVCYIMLALSIPQLLNAKKMLMRFNNDEN